MRLDHSVSFYGQMFSTRTKPIKFLLIYFSSKLHGVWHSTVGKLIGRADAVIFTHTETPYFWSSRSTLQGLCRISTWNTVENYFKKENKSIPQKLDNGQTTFDPTSLTMDKQKRKQKKLLLASTLTRFLRGAELLFFRFTDWQQRTDQQHWRWLRHSSIDDIVQFRISSISNNSSGSISSNSRSNSNSNGRIMSSSTRIVAAAAAVAASIQTRIDDAICISVYSLS